MKKKTKIHYTNEDLSKKFKSNFDLVNYAISLAENMIKSGRETRVKSDVQNRAMLILQEIQEGKDQFDDIKDFSRGSISSQSVNGEEIHVEHRSEKRKFASSEPIED